MLLTGEGVLALLCSEDSELLLLLVCIRHIRWLTVAGSRASKLNTQGLQRKEISTISPGLGQTDQNTPLICAGRSPRSLHADVEIGGARLASVFARLPMGRFLAHHDIDGSTHQLHFGDDAHHGMRPVAMTGWRRSGEDRWASVWRPTTSEWTARHGIDSNEAMRETVRRGGRGLEPAFLSGHATAGGARWAGGWVRPRRQFTVLGEVGSADFCNQLDAKMRDYMQKHDIPGAQLAVTRGGSFLHCRAYTWADSRQPPITPRTRFRLASISKPITAAAIEWLIQEGRLQRDAKVFELLGLATPSGNDRARRFARISVDHLLTHTGGWKRADSDTSPLQQDPMMIDELVALGRPRAPAEWCRLRRPVP